MTKGKCEAGIQFYNNLETSEREAEIYKVVKQRAGANVGEMMAIRNQKADIVTNEKKIKDRWAEYFNELLNKGNKRDPLTQAESTKRPVLDE